MPQISMSALRAHARGGPEQLVLEDLDTPEPRHDEVLVEVRAVGITFAELQWEETWTRDGRSRLPVIPGHEFSGVVAKLGSDARGYQVGDPVLGMAPFDQDGAAASYVRVPTGHLVSKPADLSHVTAAALPLAGLTAWQALVEHGHLTHGERVLVHGGAGSVGAMVVQLARRLGAHVTATARQPDHYYVRSLGATGVVELDTFDRASETYDIVVDTIGGDTASRSITTLRQGGRLVCLTAPFATTRRDVTSIFFVVVPDSRVLTELAELAADGRLQVPVARLFPLEKGRAAYESGMKLPRLPGKTVITVHGEHL
jgi:NADPH:quinone reductase-like Zn-dependent oxidoreductase